MGLLECGVGKRIQKLGLPIRCNQFWKVIRIGFGMSLGHQVWGWGELMLLVLDR